MSDLDELLKQNSRVLYNANEMSEILLGLYSSLGIAFAIKAETIVVPSFRRILCLDKAGEVIFPPKSWDWFDVDLSDVQRVSNLGVMDLIMSRDRVVNQRLALISRSPEKCVYSVKSL